MRKKIYDMLERTRHGDVYNYVMLVAIVVSIIPLMFVEEHPAFRVTEIITVSLFILDYVLRWITADYRLGKKGWSFLLYPFTGWATIDMLSKFAYKIPIRDICPSTSVLSFTSLHRLVTGRDSSRFFYSEPYFIVVWVIRYKIRFSPLD